MVKEKSLDFFAASILLILIYVYVHPLDANAISVDKGQFSRRVAKAVCTATKKFATSKQIQPPLNDASKFPKEESQPCQRLQWKACGAHSGGDCRRFELKGCPGPKISKRRLIKTKKLKPKIVGGTDAEPSEFPHQVIFYIPLPYDEFGFGRCGGSVLNKNYILSAAHCFYERSPEGIVVTAGDYDITEEEGTEQNRTIKSIVIHEGYVDKSKLNDIALLKLNQPLDLTPQVRPVLLADKKFVIPDMATGWGSLHYGGDLGDLMVMQRVDVPIVLWQECEKKYQDDHIKIFPTNICAGAEDRDACQGDSGGPLTVKDAKGQFNQIGIVSFGFGCGFPDYPGVYTLIPEYIDWINKNSKG